MKKVDEIEKTIKGLRDLQKTTDYCIISYAIAYLGSQKNTIIYLKGRVRNLIKKEKSRL